MHPLWVFVWTPELGLCCGGWRALSLELTSLTGLLGF